MTSPRPRPRIIAFDLDGTLVDTAPDLVGALNHVLTSEGLPAVPLHLARPMIGAGARRMIELGLEREDRVCGPDSIDQLIVKFLNYYTAHIADESRPFDGLTAALDDLESQGWQFVVCTNKFEGLARLLLDELDLTSRFLTICGADTFGVAKPDPVILRQTIARAGGEMSSTIMVGDAGPDVGVARRAGIPVVGVTFGYTEIPIADLKPDRVITHMDQLPDAIQTLAMALKPA